MKVFITGATGILGRQIVNQLFVNGFEVIALEKGKDENRRKQVYNHEKIEWIDGDLGDLMAIQKGMEKADYVIHSAALVSFDPSERARLNKINVEGTANVVNCALVAPNLKKLVHVSSVATLSPTKPDPAQIDERNGFNPENDTSDYARSKHEAELEIARGVEEGLLAAMVNPSVILSQGSIKESSTTLFGYAKKGWPFYPSGWINYVDGRDVCDFIIKLLTAGPCKGEKLVLSAGYIPYKDFLKLAAQELKVKPPNVEVTPWLSSLGWKIDSVYSFLFQKKPFLTRFTASASAKRLIFRSNCLHELWPDFRFRSLENSIKWVCSNLR